MPGITLDAGNAAELAGMLSFLAGWRAGSQQQALAGSLAAVAGHPADTAGALRAGLHRFAFLPGLSNGGELSGEPAP